MSDPIHITDLEDPRIDVFRDVRDKDLRGHDDVFMAESEAVLLRLLRHPERMHAVFLSKPKHRPLAKALAALPDEVPVYVAELELMTQIAGFHIHRGVLAAGRRPHRDELTLDEALGHLRVVVQASTPAQDRATTSDEGENARTTKKNEVVLLLAEGLTNVDNIGGLFRNAAAFGVDGVVLDPACCDPLYRKAVRVSMGHVLSIPYAVSRDWPGDLARLKAEWGVTLVGAESGQRAAPLWTMPARQRVGLVFGSEAYGLSPRALEACDVVCEIPMTENVPSINVANAVAVFLYEVRRGERRPGRDAPR